MSATLSGKDCFDCVFDYFLIVFWIEGKTTLKCCLVANFKNHEKLKIMGPMKRNTSLMKTVYAGKIQEWHDELEKK